MVLYLVANPLTDIYSDTALRLSILLSAIDVNLNMYYLHAVCVIFSLLLACSKSWRCHSSDFLYCIFFKFPNSAFISAFTSQMSLLGFFPTTLCCGVIRTHGRVALESKGRGWKVKGPNPVTGLGPLKDTLPPELRLISYFAIYFQPDSRSSSLASAAWTRPTRWRQESLRPSSSGPSRPRSCVCPTTSSRPSSSRNERKPNGERFDPLNVVVETERLVASFINILWNWNTAL